ncbi:MAG TPA: carboxylesterase family protein [Steroidobacteraceae bacterium]|nr:carboxylesterase family protein [Steroidobacteraceae bacterium]
MEARLDTRAEFDTRVEAVRWLRQPIILCLLAAVAATAVPAVAQEGRGDADGGPVVNTAEGPVRGFTKNGVEIFLGIPYAAPPVGDLRWTPPQAVRHWTETRDANRYGKTCPQVYQLGVFAAPTSISEDCLYLNVFTTAEGHNSKPVIVWIHGGGNFDGESNDYDGSKLATGGSIGTPAVVVTFNYRLNMFGFFSHPAINAEGHRWGNYGILDQQAVLSWVQRNIAAFGGDPTRVALGGQSAGAQDTAANVLSPLSKGLFNRAIVQSTPGFTTFVAPAAVAATNGINFAAAAGCPGTKAAAAACLRKLSAARILQLSATGAANSPYVTGLIVDGSVIPIAPGQAWTTGQFNKMPMMGGAVKDEITFFTGINEWFSGPPQAPLTADQYAAAVGPVLAAEYPVSAYGGDPMLAYERAVTDQFKCTELHVVQLWAVQTPTYAYDFVYQNAPYYFAKMPGFRPLAAHTIDIQFLFPGWHGGDLGVNIDQGTGEQRELNAAETGLSDQLVAAWTNFAATGNPNGSGDSPWPVFTAGSQKYFVEDLSVSTETVEQFRSAYKCDFWDPRLGL